MIENAFATPVYHPNQMIVHHTFHQPISGETFRQVLLSGIELLKQHGAQVAL
jgi:hypothetical protein